MFDYMYMTPGCYSSYLELVTGDDPMAPPRQSDLSDGDVCDDGQMPVASNSTCWIVVAKESTEGTVSALIREAEDETLCEPNVYHCGKIGPSGEPVDGNDHNYCANYPGTTPTRWGGRCVGNMDVEDNTGECFFDAANSYDTQTCCRPTN